MNIVVCVKQVPDTTEIKIDPVKNTLIRQGVPSIMNPFDKNALEEALQLKEEYGGTVTVISMGPQQAKATLRQALSMGADKAHLVTDRAFGGSDTYATSYILSKVIEKLGPFDVILGGKQAIDGDTGQTPPVLRNTLALPDSPIYGALNLTGINVLWNGKSKKVLKSLKQSFPFSVLQPKKPTNQDTQRLKVNLIR